MEKGPDKLMKTYGRHKNRVIKTDIWDSKFNTCRENIFNLSNSFGDDSDFLEVKQTRNGFKRKKTKGENKENKITKAKLKKKSKIDDNLFSEKEIVSSFTDCGGGGGPLKNLLQQNVLASTKKCRLGNRTKLHLEESQLPINSKEKNVSISFSEFDSYNLCISDSPVQADAKTTETSTPKELDNMGKVLSPEVFLQNKKPCTRLNNFESLSQKNSILVKPQKAGITTSTPLGPFVALSRLPKNIKTYQISEDYSLFEQSHANSSQGGRSCMTSFNDPDESIRYNNQMASVTQPMKNSTTKSANIGLSEHSFDDSALRLNPDLESDDSLNLSQRFDQIVSLQSKEPQSSPIKKQASHNTKKDWDDDGDITKNKSSRSHTEFSYCANCSLDHPCGEHCAFVDIKLNPYICLQKLENFFGSFVKDKEPENPETSSLNFDASRDLMESYSPALSLNHSMEKQHHDDDSDDEVGTIFDIREDLKLETTNKGMNSIFLSDVEEEDEELEDSVSCNSSDDQTDPASSISGNDRTSEEDGSEDISYLYTCASPVNCNNVKQTEIVNALLSLRESNSNLIQNCTSPIPIIEEERFTDKSSTHLQSYHRSPYMTRCSKLQISVEDTKMESFPCTPDNKNKTSDADVKHPSRVSPAMNASTPRKSLIAILSPKVSHLSPRSKVLQQCEQDGFISFKECITSSMMKNCVKIGEGAYGEVFRTKQKGQSVALKIIPIEGDFEVNECLQKNFLEIFPEIVISKELSDLRNEIDDNTPSFVSVNSVSCLKGVYPAPLMREWDIFHKEKRSENDRPDIFDKNQLFILFNFEDGGSALENFKFSNVHQAKSILQQVAYGLAIAESALQFEHRDLHWGNVLVRPSPNEMLHLKLKGEDILLPSWGLETCIIDFTLSRLQKDGCTVFCDLAKDDLLFEGKGDYQFDVYRLMREETENHWDRFCPKTNVYWIHYLADKLLKCKKYDKTSAREDNEILRMLRQFVRDGTDYASAVHLVTACPFFMASVS